MYNISNTKPNSNWEQKKNHHSINTCIEAVDSDIEKILEHKQTLSQNEKTIINKFSKHDLVFTKIAKGGAAVILDVENYIEKANIELNNENYCKKLNQDLTQVHIKTINNAIETFSHNCYHHVLI